MSLPQSDISYDGSSEIMWTFDKNSLETYLYLCLTIYHSVRATNILRIQFLVHIDLKPPAKFHENPIKTLHNKTI